MNLKPCPFCNSADVDLDGIVGGYYISCNSCHADGPEAESTVRAGELWNIRRWTEWGDPAPPTGDSDE